MSRLTLFVILLASTFLAATGFGLWSLYREGITGGCENTVVQTLSSPDGLREAVLFERSCGATTGFTSQVAVLSPADSLDEVMPVFAADTDHGQAEAGPWGGPWVELRWISQDWLEIAHEPRSRVFKSASEAAGVHIRYRPTLPPQTSSDTAARSPAS